MAQLSGSLDANVLLRIILADVPEQHQAALNLLDHPQGLLGVADTAFIETVFVLERYYQLPRSVIAEALEGLITLPQISCNHQLIQKTLPLYTAHHKLSFEDCYLATQAHIQEATPLWTFDKKLATQVEWAKMVSKPHIFPVRK